MITTIAEKQILVTKLQGYLATYEQDVLPLKLFQYSSVMFYLIFYSLSLMHLCLTANTYFLLN